MTVHDLITALNAYPQDAPVIATWEGQLERIAVYASADGVVLIDADSESYRRATESANLRPHLPASEHPEAPAAEPDLPAKRFHVHVDGFVAAPDIDGAMQEISRHFAEVMSVERGLGRFTPESVLDVRPAEP